MPELPEVETVRRTLEPVLEGRTVTAVEVRRRDLRRRLVPDFESRLTGRRIVGIGRRAKYLLARLDDRRSWIVHLGMSGRLLHRPAPREESVADAHAHLHVSVRLDDGSAVEFHDPRRFGLMLVENAEDCDLLRGVGPEPLDADGFDSRYLTALKRRTRRTVKDVLMDQRVVAGIGNIYVNEILFAAGVRPGRRMHRVTSSECDRLVEAVRTVLAEAIAHRGTSMSDFLDGIGRRGGYQWRRRVYDRTGEPCPVCGAAIRHAARGGRSSFFCPRCQR